MRPHQMTAVMKREHADSYVGSSTDVFCYDDPDRSRLSSITAAHFWWPLGGAPTHFPAIFGEMTALTTLTINGSGRVEPSFLADARQEDFPPRLTNLSLSLDHGRVQKWPQVVLPHLTHLFTGEQIRFKNEMLPQLTSLSFPPDRALKALDQVRELPLTELNLLNVPTDERIFDLLAGRPLERLGLLNSNTLPTLTGIDQLPGLVSLRLKNLRALRSIGAARGLPLLSDLNIQYCSAITDVQTIAELAALRELRLIGCGAVGLAPLRSTLEGLEHADTSASS
ncbi:MAG: hypothetical protein ACTJHU_07110 [Mycetocola sp.]